MQILFCVCKYIYLFFHIKHTCIYVHMYEHNNHFACTYSFCYTFYLLISIKWHILRCKSYSLFSMPFALLCALPIHSDILSLLIIRKAHTYICMYIGKRIWKYMHSMCRSLRLWCWFLNWKLVIILRRYIKAIFFHVFVFVFVSVLKKGLFATVPTCLSV